MRSLPALNEVGFTCFRDLIYQEVKANARDSVLTLREGERIDRELLKNVKDIFVEIGMGDMELYEEDFEAQMLQDSVAYYPRKASSWISNHSCPEYMLKAEECLRSERDTVSNYLHISTEQKLVEKVQQVLVVVHQPQQLEKDQSGCCDLQRDDDQLEDAAESHTTTNS